MSKHNQLATGHMTAMTHETGQTGQGHSGKLGKLPENSDTGNTVTAVDVRVQLGPGDCVDRVPGARGDEARAPAVSICRRRGYNPPHIAWATRAARARLMRIAEENVRSFLADKPANVVNEERVRKRSMGVPPVNTTGILPVAKKKKQPDTGGTPVPRVFEAT